MQIFIHKQRDGYRFEIVQNGNVLAESKNEYSRHHSAVRGAERLIRAMRQPDVIIWTAKAGLRIIR